MRKELRRQDITFETKDQPLRDDVRILGTLVGDLLRDQGGPELFELVEKCASTQVFAVLKRPDEKHVTEAAYDNPKFVEDMVRDVARRLNEDDRIVHYVVESENFESIHNHSAYALIEKDKAGES